MKQLIKVLCCAILAGSACHGNATLVTVSASPNAAIGDSPDSGVASGIYISPGNSQLNGIVNPYVSSIASVNFTITGGWAGDYTVVLQHVNYDGSGSQSLTLFSLLLGGAASNNGFTDVTLSSTGTGSISDGASTSSSAAITGTYGMDFGTTFQNVSPTGDWILFVRDGQADSTGTLTSWSLNLQVVPEPVNVALGVFGVVLVGTIGIRRFQQKRKAVST